VNSIGAGTGELDATTLKISTLTANSTFNVNVTNLQLKSTGGNMSVTATVPA